MKIMTLIMKTINFSGRKIKEEIKVPKRLRWESKTSSWPQYLLMKITTD